MKNQTFWSLAMALQSDGLAVTPKAKEKKEAITNIWLPATYSRHS